MSRINSETLEKFSRDLLVAGGFTKAEAEITAKSLILSNLMGHDSHGIMRARQYNEELKNGNIKSGVDLKFLQDTPISIHADAQRGLGQVQMSALLGLLFNKAKTKAVVTGILNNCGHVGRLGEWVDRCAAQNYAAFMAVNDNGTFQMVAPAGGIEARTSTNPIAFALPLQGDIFSIDLSTSATAAGKMRLAHITGETAPEGLLQDHQGKPTTDPSCLFEDPKGSILPFGGYKGFALSMMVDCLVSGLSGGFTPPAPDDAPALNNVMITLWNPEFFSGIAHMKSEAEKYLDYVRNTKPVDAEHPVRVPGDRAKAEMATRLRNGIPMDDKFWSAITQYATALGVDVPDNTGI